MKQKNISMMGFVCINELYQEEPHDAGRYEMAFDEENIKKLINSQSYQSALYHDALKNIH